MINKTPSRAAYRVRNKQDIIGFCLGMTSGLNKPLQSC